MQDRAKMQRCDKYARGSGKICIQKNDKDLLDLLLIALYRSPDTKYSICDGSLR